MEILLRSIDGRIDINQWKATSTIHVGYDSPIVYLCQGRRCKLHLPEGIRSTQDGSDGYTNLITLNGYGSELTVRE